LNRQTNPVQKSAMAEKTQGSYFPGSLELVLTAALIGLLTGLSAIALRWLIVNIRTLSYSTPSNFIASIYPFHFILILTIGGLLNGLIIQFITSEVKGGGIPEILEAVAIDNGHIPPIVSFAKILATGICLGTGGSAGSFGPIAHIGASIGSSIGQLFKLNTQRIRTLVACGVAGGIASTMNTPIAGAVFAIEIILDNISSVNFSAVVITSVIASTISHQFMGNAALIPIPAFSSPAAFELLFFALLGILAAVFATGFSRIRYLVDDWFSHTHIPQFLVPAIGGVLVGTIGMLTMKLNGFPRIFGVGYESIVEIFSTGMAFRVSIILLLLKMMTTALTVGTGNSGGVFAPSLFMGAMLGQCFGILINLTFPETSSPPGVYAVVGMAAFFSGAVRAPITSILIILEITGNYNLILPLMLTTVSSSLISKWISEDTIYTAKMTRKGIDLKKERLSAREE